MVKIEEEYKKHKVPEEIKEKMIDPYVLVLNIDDVVKRLESEESHLLAKRRKNHFLKNISIFNTNVLKAEDEVYSDMVLLIDDNLNLLINIVEMISEDTYLELSKLVDFIITNYTNNKAYYDAKLKSIDYATKGINFIDNRKSNNQKMLNAFVNKKIIDMKAQKLLEKK